ncbi:RNA polymerase sigma factor [Chitinophaga sp. XS-30]|uniref:RNA polymerase sigma factor n=1 Tax=Chitinophaga sp. XS-30 TaxID=2604421 RepID=UPI0011DCBE01|nr:sigma-70 family RNA polymerase sigma factor [Chitinophaga sp. XS-30]QEH39739.1 sigma-70 family RNA polymerase sigma factor [Chitinophaga sp. XS-30]
MEHQALIPHLFRTEAGRITAVLCRNFGLEHIGAAEDITSETFMAALETWPYKGIPENPAAWLHAVAKNKARNYLARHQRFTGKVAPRLREDGASTIPETEIDLSDNNITDSQLQMLFAICHPAIPVEAQIALALRILCGFGIGEIAHAFLVSPDTISKRLTRAKEKLRTAKDLPVFPSGQEINNRLDAVLLTLYLLFNEGCYSETQDTVLREDLCLEAMRLTYLLLGNNSTNQPEVNALLALMCFHASRFPARKDRQGGIILYHDQDESRWDAALIAKGAEFLHRASTGNRVSRYHLEASIAYWHTIRTDSEEKWENILQLYNQLLTIAYSPVAALNRTFALSKTKGKPEAIKAAVKLQLTDNPYYHALLGELYVDIDNAQARKHFETAHALAGTAGDKRVLQTRLDALADQGEHAAKNSGLP